MMASAAPPASQTPHRSDADFRLRSDQPGVCRYITRPAIANERLTLNRAGQVVLTLKTPYRDGTTPW
jgi:hypothetical protein